VRGRPVRGRLVRRRLVRGRIVRSPSETSQWGRLLSFLNLIAWSGRLVRSPYNGKETGLHTCHLLSARRHVT
jgi:hypothetical protein